jgi:hypothetical protein
MKRDIPRGAFFHMDIATLDLERIPVILKRSLHGGKS